MRNIQGLPLADPPSDSLGRLNGQCPGLFYVACANNVGVVCVATSRANKLRLASTAGRIHNPAFGARLRGVRRIGELKLAAAFDELIAEHVCEHAPTLVEDASIEARLDRNVTAGFLERPALRRNVTDSSLPPSGRYPRKRTQPILGSLMTP